MKKLYLAKNINEETKEEGFMIGTFEEVEGKELVNEISGSRMIIVPAINLFKDLEESVYSLVHVKETKLKKEVLKEQELKENIMDFDIVYLEKISLNNCIMIDHDKAISYIQNNTEITEIKENKLYLTLLKDIKVEINVEGAFTMTQLASTVLDIIYEQIDVVSQETPEAIASTKEDENDIIDVKEIEEIE